ncbi:hypothetical protein [Mycobacterium vicinigordonae]|uniref:Uncharacterized protein n=1 Tax=Mycobacterium vicinigordonae TaxID=1719132 RepID=A0A7D6E6E4_9MYCO|nr:hypothetical protein [Mycobacterium vicinigordonae]QLL07863.1 hypothetical protein H0P51_02365 [Mycobacterium vicinigordonae]
MKQVIAAHVMEYDHSGGKLSLVFNTGCDSRRFARVLRELNGGERSFLALWAIPPNMDYETARAAGLDALCIRATGRSDAMAVEICKVSDSEWATAQVRYAVGRRDEQADRALDTPATHSHCEIQRRFVFFSPDEVANMFYDYFSAGDIGPCYDLRPQLRYRHDGTTSPSATFDAYHGATTLA